MLEPFQWQEKSYFLIKRENHPELVAGFTTRKGGVSQAPYVSNNLGLHVRDDHRAVLVNRNRIASSLDFPLNRWVFARQTHGDHIHRVTENDRGLGTQEYDTGIPVTDGLYTDEKGILLALAFADCVPLYFHAPDHGRIGIAHAGWRGTVQNIGAKMIMLWEKDGIPPEDVFTVIGPAICATCYVVDERVIAQVEKLPVSPFYQIVSENQYALDLKALNRALLQQAGVPEKQILVSRYCTSCNPDLFFSHRRDAKMTGTTGRMLAFIGIKEDG